MKQPKRQPIQFTFNPDECTGGVKLQEKLYVIEVLGFVAMHSIIEASKYLGVDSEEFYNAYCDARNSIIKPDYPIQKLSLGDLDLRHVQRLRNNIVADNFKLLQAWSDKQEKVS